MATTDTIELKIKLDDRASRQLKDIDKALNGLNGRMGGLTTSSGAAAGALGGLVSKITPAKLGIAALGVATVATTRAIIESARAYENTVNQLRLVTTSTQDYNETIERLSKLAKENRTSFDATVELFTKLKVSTDELGFSTSQVETLTSKLSKALAVAGADAMTTNGVIRQFGQAMASGTVRGDEFNSIVEGLGPALSIMAKESGINVGKLREMSRAGKLSAEVFANMLLNSTALDESFNKLEPTLDQIDIAFKDANIKLGNAVSQFLGLSEAVKSAKQAFTIFAEAMTIALTPDADPLMSEITRVQNQIALLEKQASELQPEIIPRITIDFGQDNGLDDAIREIPDLAELEVIAAGGTEVDKLKEKLAQLNMQLFRRAEAESLANLEAFKTAQEDKKRAEEKAAIIAAEKARLDLMRKIRDAEAESMKQLAEFMKQQKQAQDSLISSNESALSSENALRLQYSRNRDTIAELNEILKRNVDLTDEQKELIPQIIQGLTAQNNTIHHQIKSGSQLFDIYQKTAVALRENKLERENLLNAVSQLEMQMSSEQFQTEENKALMHGYNEALKENAEVRRQLLGIPLPDDEMTIEKLTKQVDLNVRNKAINEGLLETFKELKPSVDELAEAYRILGISMPVDDKTLESYKEFTERMDRSARETVNLTNNQKKLLEHLKKVKKETGELTEVQKVQLEQLSKGTEDTQTKVFDLAKSVEEAFDKSISSVSGAMADMLLGLGNGFQSLQEIAMNTLRSIIAALIEATVRAAILKATGATAGTSVGSALLGAIGGTAALPGIGLLIGAGAILGGAFANGGTVSTGRKPILVGERGPELFLPGRAGEVVSNENLNTMQGGEPLTVQFNINAIDTQTGAQFIVENKRLITGVVQDAYRRRAETGPLG